ncbi:MAG: hypothetical protein R3F11_06575 [Verrucomicrobiales bacterium]
MTWSIFVLKQCKSLFVVVIVKWMRAEVRRYASRRSAVFWGIAPSPKIFVADRLRTSPTSDNPIRFKSAMVSWAKSPLEFKNTALIRRCLPGDQPVETDRHFRPMFRLSNPCFCPCLPDIFIEKVMGIGRARVGCGKLVSN